MHDVRLLDSCFNGQQAAGLAGENLEEAPQHFRWCRSECDSLHTWYTDSHIADAVNDFRPARVAWLIEPPSSSIDHYKQAYKHRRRFKAIFTYIDWYLAFGRPYRPYQLGGSWISPDRWGLYAKWHMVSMIMSQKTRSEGHRLRHRVRKRFEDVRVFGRGIDPVGSKMTALAPFMYSIVIESWRGSNYFSEKLIDCLAVGTVPIYWGTPDIGKYFDMDGIIPFTTMVELSHILSKIGSVDYARRQWAVEANIERAKKYRCAEDRIFADHPDLFA